MKKNKIVVLILSLIAFIVAPNGALDKNIKPNNIIKVKKIKNKNPYPFLRIKKRDLATKEVEKKQNTSLKEDTETENEQKEQWQIGYCSDCVNVRVNPDVNSEILQTFDFNTPIKYTYYNEEWVKIDYNNSFYYISKQFITTNSYDFVDYSIPYTSGFKSYMPYTSITSKTSLQYKTQYEYAYTGKFGIRQVNSRFCVAIGTAFGADVGTYIDLILENNEIIPAIVADIKANKDTDSSNIITVHNNCVSEFVVDNNCLNKNISIMGDVSGAKPEWNSRVATIRIYSKNIFVN